MGGRLVLVAVMVAAGLAFWTFHDAMVPNTSAAERAQPCGAAYPCFKPLIYGADVVLPIVDLGQEAEWRHETKSSGRELAENLRWAFVAVGWVLGSIFVAAFTNLIRRD